MTYRHVILDRDGVLNREAPDSGYISKPSEFFWVPGALEALASLRRAGVYLSVATNQSGVGRGLMSLAELEAVHERMRTEAEQNGAGLDAVLFCPHAPASWLRPSKAGARRVIQGEYPLPALRRPKVSSSVTTRETWKLRSARESVPRWSAPARAERPRRC